MALMVRHVVGRFPKKHSPKPLFSATTVPTSGNGTVNVGRDLENDTTGRRRVLFGA